MASNVNEAGIFTPATNLALVADVQYLEPFGSGAFNRKMLGILLPGIFRGFDCKPGTGLNIVISSTADGTGAACIEVGGYQITVQQLKDATVPIPKGTTTIVALEANYGQGKLTKQVSATATLDAARFVTVPQGTALKANQIEVCRVTLSASATSITQANINMETRTRRRVGPIISDSITSTEKYQVASSNAVRLALAAAKAESDKKLIRGENGTGVNLLQLDQNFDWQTHDFKGGEYVYFSWQTAKNNPPLGYPDGYYQIMVTGLAMAGLATLLIRPINYTQPLTPFLISWTVDANGKRIFKYRAVYTSLPDINLVSGTTPNSLNLVCHVGEYSQPDKTKATTANGYPVGEAGVLKVLMAGTAVQQEYISSTSGRRFSRGRIAATAPATGLVWGQWVELARTIDLTNAFTNLGLGIANQSYSTIDWNTIKFKSGQKAFAQSDLMQNWPGPALDAAKGVAITCNYVMTGGTANAGQDSAGYTVIVQTGLAPSYHIFDVQTVGTGATRTFSVREIVTSVSGTAPKAVQLATARNIGGVSFNGTANIDLPGVNKAGNQNTSGNAATATKLATARKINGVAFDGSKDITFAADDINGVPKNILGTITNGGSMLDANKTGWWQIQSADPSTITDFPKDENGSLLYGFGFMWVQNYGANWQQIYYSHHGVIAYRQDWKAMTAGIPWTIDLNTAHKPSPAFIGAIAKTGDTMTGEFKIYRPVNGSLIRMYTDNAADDRGIIMYKSGKDELSIGSTAVGSAANGGITGSAPFKLNMATGSVTLNHQLFIDTGSNLSGLVMGSPTTKGMVFRISEGNFHLLPSNDNGIDGTWSSLRPFSMTLDTGQINMGCGLYISHGGLGVGGTKISELGSNSITIGESKTGLRVPSAASLDVVVAGTVFMNFSTANAITLSKNMHIGAASDTVQKMPSAQGMIYLAPAAGKYQPALIAGTGSQKMFLAATDNRLGFYVVNNNHDPANVNADATAVMTPTGFAISGDFQVTQKSLFRNAISVSTSGAQCNLPGSAISIGDGNTGFHSLGTGNFDIVSSNTVVMNIANGAATIKSKMLVGSTSDTTITRLLPKYAYLCSQPDSGKYQPMLRSDQDDMVFFTAGGANNFGFYGILQSRRGPDGSVPATDTAGSDVSALLTMNGWSVRGNMDVSGPGYFDGGVVVGAPNTATALGATSVAVGEANTGIRLSAAKQLAVVANGVDMLVVSAAGIQVKGTINSTADVHINGGMFISSSGAISGLGANSLALGDSDTGLKWKSDGNFDIMSNNAVNINIGSGRTTLKARLLVDSAQTSRIGLRTQTNMLFGVNTSTDKYQGIIRVEGATSKYFLASINDSIGWFGFKNSRADTDDNSDTAMVLSMSGLSVQSAITAATQIYAKGGLSVGATTGAPGLGSNSIAIGEAKSGMRYNSTGNLDLMANNTPVLNFTTAGVKITGTLNVSAGVHFAGSLFVGSDATPGILGANAIAIGDPDTGLKWISDNKVGFYSSNQMVGSWTPDGIQAVKAFLTTATTGATVLDDTHGMDGQLNSGAPVYINQPVVPSADSQYYPMIKIKTQTDKGYPCAASLGYRTVGQAGWGKILLSAAGDKNYSKTWEFNIADGGFLSPGNIVTSAELHSGNAVVRGALTVAMGTAVSSMGNSSIAIGEANTGFDWGGASKLTLKMGGKDLIAFTGTGMTLTGNQHNTGTLIVDSMTTVKGGMVVGSSGAVSTLGANAIALGEANSGIRKNTAAGDMSIVASGSTVIGITTTGIAVVGNQSLTGKFTANGAGMFKDALSVGSAGAASTMGANSIALGEADTGFVLSNPAEISIKVDNTTMMRMTKTDITIGGAISSSKNISTTAALNAGNATIGSGIELGGASGNPTPFIDFHYNKATTDYDVRLIASPNGLNFQTTGSGKHYDFAGGYIQAPATAGGSLGGQLDTKASYYAELKNLDNADHNYYPLAKMRIEKKGVTTNGVVSGNYPLAASIGVMTNVKSDNTADMPVIVIHGRSTNSDSRWLFHPDTGLFETTGQIQSGDIHAGNVYTTGVYVNSNNMGFSPSSLPHRIDIRFDANSVVGYLDSGEFHYNTQITSNHDIRSDTTIRGAYVESGGDVKAMGAVHSDHSVYASGSEHAVDGNIYGSVWGGWLNNFIANNIFNVQNTLLINAILGAETFYGDNDGGASHPGGNVVVTGVGDFGSNNGSCWGRPLWVRQHDSNTHACEVA